MLHKQKPCIHSFYWRNRNRPHPYFAAPSQGTRGKSPGEGMRPKACHSPEAGFTLHIKKLNKHLQVGCWLRKGQPGACKKSKNRSLKISSLFQIYGIGDLGPHAPGSSLLDTLGHPSLSASVTLRDSRTTPPGYCVNTKTGTFLDGERKTN